jgi:hypothetical protein
MILKIETCKTRVTNRVKTPRFIMFRNAIFVQQILKAMTKGLPYHTNNPDYLDAVYHDNTECIEGKKIRLAHRKPGTGNKPHCTICIALAAVQDQEQVKGFVQTKITFS